MVKVLEPGQPSEWSAQVRCTGQTSYKVGCGALLLVDEKDLRKRWTGQGDDGEMLLVVQCPQCGLETQVAGVPAFIAQDVKA